MLRIFSKWNGIFRGVAPVWVLCLLVCDIFGSCADVPMYTMSSWFAACDIFGYHADGLICMITCRHDVMPGWIQTTNDEPCGHGSTPICMMSPWFGVHTCVWYLPTSCRCTHKHEEKWFGRCDVLGYHTDGHNCRIKKSRHADVTPNITHFFSMSWDWYHAFFHMTRSNITQHIHGVTFHMLVCFTQLSHLLKKAPCGKRRDILNASKLWLAPLGLGSQ